MKLVPFVLFIFILVSCGQDTKSSSSTGRRGLCDLNGNSVDCSAIEGADGQGIDLLNAMIEVPVKIQDSDITFLADKTSSSTGRRITCKTSVRNGEVYRFALRGDGLILMTEQGTFEFTRISDGEGLQGAWTWKGYVDQGMHLIRNITFVENNRVIIRNHCEL
jgi:hypothetical protein